MANRTIQIQGLSYGAIPSGVTATLNDTTVFSGTVTTLNQPIPALPDSTLEGQIITLFSFDVDLAITGNVSVSCEVSDGTVIFTNILSNYALINNPVFSPEQFAIVTSSSTTQAEKFVVWNELANPPFSAEDEATLLTPGLPFATRDQILVAHNVYPYINDPTEIAPLSGNNSLDPRFNVEINGVAQSPTRDLPGCWWWTVGSNSTLSWQMNLPPTILLT